jgi:1,4-dihydroxy-2-naphthoate octaprenyltransferase
VPVAVGAAVAVGEGEATAWWRAGAALVVSVALQVGVNFANDYSDGVRGTDGGDRVGPLRLVGSGLVEPGRVKRAATASFAAAGLVGAVLALVVGPEVFLVGAAALLAGWTYTGGPRPYGYLGLGEVFVFVFFGVVATVGTTYVLLERIDGVAVACSVAVGLWATALLVINNLRDIPGDTVAGKRTLAVRIGDRPTRAVYVVMIDLSFFVAVAITITTGRGAAAAVLGIPFAIGALRSVVRGASGAELIAVLGATGRTQLIAGLAMAAGLALT